MPATWWSRNPSSSSISMEGRVEGKAVWCWQMPVEKAGWWLSKLFLRIRSVWDICGFSGIFSSDNFQSNLHLELKSSLPGKRSQTSFKKSDGEVNFSVTTFILQSLVMKINNKFLAILVDLTYFVTCWVRVVDKAVRSSDWSFDILSFGILPQYGKRIL